MFYSSKLMRQLYGLPLTRAPHSAPPGYPQVSSARHTRPPPAHPGQVLWKSALTSIACACPLHTTGRSPPTSSALQPSLPVACASGLVHDWLQILRCQPAPHSGSSVTTASLLLWAIVAGAKDARFNYYDDGIPWLAKGGRVYNNAEHYRARTA